MLTNLSAEWDIFEISYETTRVLHKFQLTFHLFATLSRKEKKKNNIWGKKGCCSWVSVLYFSVFSLIDCWIFLCLPIKLSGLSNTETIKIALFLISLSLCVYFPHVHTNTHMWLWHVLWDWRFPRPQPYKWLKINWHFKGCCGLRWAHTTACSRILQHLFLNLWVISLLKDAGWGDHRPSVRKRASLTALLIHMFHSSLYVVSLMSVWNTWWLTHNWHVCSKHIGLDYDQAGSMYHDAGMPWGRNCHHQLSKLCTNMAYSIFNLTLI